MKFLTGGIAREPFWQIRSDSGADSIVWMGEEYNLIVFYRILSLKFVLQGFLFIRFYVKLWLFGKTSEAFENWSGNGSRILYEKSTAVG